MNIQLTERDQQLMAWINQVGVVRIDHIAAWMQVGKTTAYKRIKKLMHHGYVIHQRVFHGLPGVYRVGANGIAVSGSPLPLVKQIHLANYAHDQMATSVCLQLAKQYQCTYTPERALRHELGLLGVGKMGHTPDGVLHLPGKNIAIEVELSKKGTRRLEKILSHYLKNFDYGEVWYFCANAEVERHLRAVISDVSFIHIRALSDVIATEKGKPV